MALNLEVPLEMIDYGCGSSSTAATTFARSTIALDDSKYDGATYYFEIVVSNADSVSRDVILEQGGSTIATIAVASGKSIERIRSASFTPTSGNNQYKVKTPQTNANNDVQVWCARIIVVQVNATKTRIQIPMGRQPYLDSSSGTGVSTGPIDSIASSTFGQTTADRWGIWNKLASLYGDTIVSWHFEALLVPPLTTRTMHASLFNKTDNTQVAASEVQHTGDTNITLKTAAFTSAEANFDDNDDFEVRIKVTGGSGTGHCHRAAVYCEISSLSKAEVFWRIHGGSSAFAANSVRQYQRALINTSAYSTPTVYFEASGYEGSAGDIVLQLNDDGTNDNGTAGSAVGSSNISYDSGTKARQRTGALTITSGNRFTVRSVRTDASTAFATGAFVVIRTVAGTLEVNAACDINNWSDSVVAAMVLSGSIGCALSFADSVSVVVTFPKDVGCDLDNWSDSPSADLTFYTDEEGADTLAFSDAAAAELYGVDSVTAGCSLSMADDVSAALAVDIGLSIADTLSFSDAVDVATARLFGDDVLVVMEIESDAGSIYLSVFDVRHPTRLYRGKVDQFGTLERSIPVPVGLPSISDVTVKVIDTARELRPVLAAKTIKGDRFSLWIGPARGSFSQFQKIYSGEITNVHESGQIIDITGRDFVYDKWNEDIPNLISRDHYPNLPENVNEGFAPIVYGIVSSSGTSGVGALPCVYVDTGGLRYLVSRSLCQVDAVYRKGVGDDNFALVATSEYTVTTGGETFDDDTFIMTYIVFNSDQGTGTEIRCDARNLDGPGGPGVVLENPSDLIKDFVVRFCGLVNDASQLDLASFDEVATKCNTLGWVGAGAIVSKMTRSDALAQISRSFGIDCFQNKNALFAINLTTDDDVASPTYDDVYHIIRDSASQALADPTFNRFRYFYNRSFADGQWGSESVFDNGIDQDALGKIIEESVELPFVRDASIAAAVVRDRAGYVDLNSHRITFDLPAPLVVDSLELARLVKVTYFGGFTSDGLGYVAEPFKIIRVTLDIDNLKYTVECVRRSVPPDLAQATLETSFARNARTGPYLGNGSGVLYGVFRSTAGSKTKLEVWKSTNYGQSWDVVDAASAPDLTNRIESFDSVKESDGQIYMATQEVTTGRVAYHVFDTDSDAWTVVNEEVVASISPVPANVQYYVSIEHRSVSGEPVIFYEGSGENVAGTDYRRGRYAIKQSGTWTTEVEVGNMATVARDFRGARVFPGAGDRMHFFWNDNEGGPTPNEFHRTLRSNLAFTAAVRWLNSPLVYYPATYNAGGIIMLEDGRIMVPFKSDFARPRVAVFTDADTLVLLYHHRLSSGFANEGVNGIDSTADVPIYLTEIDGVIHSITAMFDSVPGDYFDVYRSSDDFGQTWTPDGTTDPLDYRASEIYAYPDKLDQTRGLFVTIGSTLYLAKFSYAYEAATPTVLFEWINVDSEIPRT